MMREQNKSGNKEDITKVTSFTGSKTQEHIIKH